MPLTGDFVPALYQVPSARFVQASIVTGGIAAAIAECSCNCNICATEAHIVNLQVGIAVLRIRSAPVFFPCTESVAARIAHDGANELISQDYFAFMLSDYFIAARNISDKAAAEWLEANRDKLPPDHYTAIYKELFSISTDALKEVYLPPDGERISALTSAGKYADAAALLSALKSQYNNTIDGKLAGEFMNDWRNTDPEAALNWLMANAPYIQGGTALIAAPLFRAWGSKDPDKAFQAASSITDPVMQAYAMSNLIIVNAEKDPGTVADDVIKGMKSDFVKARSIAGFILGSSRCYEDSDLEVITKRQLMNNEINLHELSQAISKSKLPAEIADRAQALIVNYSGMRTAGHMIADCCRSQ